VIHRGNNWNESRAASTVANLLLKTSAMQHAHLCCQNSGDSSGSLSETESQSSAASAYFQKICLKWWDAPFINDSQWGYFYFNPRRGGEWVGNAVPQEFNASNKVLNWETSGGLSGNSQTLPNSILYVQHKMWYTCAGYKKLIIFTTLLLMLEPQKYTVAEHVNNLNFMLWIISFD